MQKMYLINKENMRVDFDSIPNILIKQRFVNNLTFFVYLYFYWVHGKPVETRFWLILQYKKTKSFLKINMFKQFSSV